MVHLAVRPTISLFRRQNTVRQLCVSIGPSSVYRVCGTEAKAPGCECREARPARNSSTQPSRHLRMLGVAGLSESEPKKDPTRRVGLQRESAAMSKPKQSTDLDQTQLLAL